MVYIIGIVLIIIVLFIIGSILRKRVYDTVDKLESWKIDVMNRNVAAELSRIKALNLRGETLEKFEEWKERWEKIVTKDLLDVEELLFDAEEAADRYRFSSANKVIHQTEQMLKGIEKEIDSILSDLKVLLNSEETSRQEAAEIEPELKILRRQLSQRRYQFGKAEREIDLALDQLNKDLATYHELTETGNYLEAKELVDDLNRRTKELHEKMEVFPAIYKAQKHELPQQFEELKRGLKEMKEDGYRVEHLGIEDEIHTYEKRLEACGPALEKGDIGEVKVLIQEIEERLKEIYELLEKEAIAKNYIETKMPGYREMIDEVAASFLDTKAEVEKMKRAYYFEDSDMEQYLALDKAVQQLKSQLDELEYELEKETSHSDLRQELERSFIQVDELQAQHESFRKRIYNLRKDELEAKEKLAEIGDLIAGLRRKLNKSNIPGVPAYIWTLMEQAAAKNSLVIKSLDKQPLDINEVQEALENAKQAVEHATEEANFMLDQAHLTEQVIQYANRYRSRNAALAASLEESERLFRNFEYELALEKAAKAVEIVEPGSLKRIETNQASMQ